MENKQGYDPSEFEDDDYTTPQPDAGKSIRGYRIVIIILSVILAALSVLYFSISLFSKLCPQGTPLSAPGAFQ